MVSKPLKFLIDTGSTYSFINPALINEEHVKKLTSDINIHTVLNTFKIREYTDKINFKQFEKIPNFKFLLFNFHSHFNGLLGMDILSSLNAKINLAESILETPETAIPILTRANPVDTLHNLPQNTKMLLPLPVNFMEGDFIFETTNLDNQVSITGGLYTANAGSAYFEVCNNSDQIQTLYLEEGLQAEEFSLQTHQYLNCMSAATDTERQDDQQLNILTEHLNSEEKQCILKLCKSFKRLFHNENNQLTFSNAIKHSIPTTDNIPIHTKSYRYPFVHKDEVRKQISKMLEQNIIKNSHSPWSAPVWVVPKKSDNIGEKKWRLVIDFRKLNEKTVSDRYPIPNIADILDSIGKTMYFTTIDLASGFHQIQMNPRDASKTAFTVENGHYEFTRMPFGLKNAPATFQRVMDNVLGDLVGNVCLVYLDDIIVFSPSLQKHIADIKSVFTKLQNANLKIQPSKCSFLRKEIDFLGHIVTQEGVKPNPLKIQTIKDFPCPKTTREIKSFLGLLGYYRKFIKDFAKITKPITRQLKGKKSIIIDDEFRQAFETSKDLLCNDPILIYPDFNKPFTLTTDASNYAIGSVLSQGPDTNDRPISFASRTLSDTEIRYSTIEKEMLAIIWSVGHFRPYLFGRRFKIVTDHKPLIWLENLKGQNPKLLRWKTILAAYDYEVVYKKGSQNVVADALSRIEPNLNINEDPRIIPIVPQPLNHFNCQIIFCTGSTTLRQLETPFIHKVRHIITEPVHTFDSVTNTLQAIMKPNKTVAIFAPDDIFKIIEESYNNYFFENDLYKIVRCNIWLTEITNPNDQENEIRAYHLNTNHRGIDETYNHLKRDIYFPHLKDTITKIIKNCDTCLTLKYDRHPHRPLMQAPTAPEGPLAVVHIDIYFINNTCNLTIIDKFTKLAQAYPLSNRNSIKVADALLQFISHYGAPKKIIFDQGAEFSGSLFNDLLTQFQITAHTTSFQQSTGNASVERLHSTLTELYRIILNKRKEARLEREHVQILAEAVATYNNAIHSSTSYTPFELFHGRTHIFNKTITFDNHHDYLKKLNEFRKDIYPKVQEHLSATTERRLAKLNKDRETPVQLEPNDTIFRKENRRNKITPKFSLHKVDRDKGVTFLTTKGQKLHKQKIRKTVKKTVAGT